MKNDLILLTLAAIAAVGSIADPAQAGDARPAEKAHAENAYRLGVQAYLRAIVPGIEKIEPQ